MTNDVPITIEKLTADKHNVVHIARHGVTPSEVEQALEGGFATLSANKPRRHRLVGATNAGRCLTVIIAETGTPHHYQLVTARTADKQERRAYITYKLKGAT